MIQKKSANKEMIVNNEFRVILIVSCLFFIFFFHGTTLEKPSFFLAPTFFLLTLRKIIYLSAQSARTSSKWR